MPPIYMLRPDGEHINPAVQNFMMRGPLPQGRTRCMVPLPRVCLPTTSDRPWSCKAASTDTWAVAQGLGCRASATLFIPTGGAGGASFYIPRNCSSGGRRCCSAVHAVHPRLVGRLARWGL